MSSNAYPSIVDKLETLVGIKEDIKTAIISKGVEVNTIEFNQYADLIKKIGQSDLDGKSYLVEVLLSKRPSLEGKITIESSLYEIANEFMGIGPINLCYKETVDQCINPLNYALTIEDILIKDNVNSNQYLQKLDISKETIDLCFMELGNFVEIDDREITDSFTIQN